MFKFLFILLPIFAYTPDDNCGFLTIDNNRIYINKPIIYFLDKSMEKYRPEIQKAMNNWNKYFDKPMLLLHKKSINISNRHMFLNYIKDVYKIKNEDGLTESDGVLAINDLRLYDSGLVKQSVILINKQKINKVDLVILITHEFGHTFGLGHSNIKKSIMYPHHLKKQKILKQDIKRLKCQYKIRGV